MESRVSLNSPLSEEEFASLKKVARGLIQSDIPWRARRNRLIELGLIRERHGGLDATGAGQLRIAQGK